MSPDSRPSTDRTRRQLLSGGGAALAMSLSTLTAGCLSSLPPLGGDQRYGRVGVPPAGDPGYRKWLPAPSSVDSSADPYHFTALGSTALRPEAPEKFVGRQAHARAALDAFGIGFENYDRFIGSNFGVVVEASFDRAEVTRTVTGTGYERDGDYRGYATFVRSDVPRRVAIGDDAIVWTSAYQHDAPNLEALVDAGAGERQRYHEADAAFDRLTAAAGDNPYLGVNTGVRDPTDRPVMLADAIRFDDDTAYQVVHYHYADGRAPTSAALEAALREDDYRFVDGADEFDVRVEGRVATVETQVPLRSDRELAPEYDLPQVTWGATYDPDADAVTFRHEAGESVPADRLYYDLDRPSVPGKIEKRDLWTGTREVAAGAETTVDLSDDPEATGVSLVYSTGGVGFHVLFGRDVRGGTDG
ncbi:hypothetical protein [Halobellus sp. H-GB7]|uniref:hypothetical protein n=1 Tax=Halobellus sp. H-GB7 TaxID=3069756 RepID=UPI0027B646D9|nr:hypothetical protein [Halobellus sp. H-GB7]MDQ2056307.1 hypothetical protein [Halobellus sp. H-GB7]